MSISNAVTDSKFMTFLVGLEGPAGSIEAEPRPQHWIRVTADTAIVIGAIDLGSAQYTASERDRNTFRLLVEQWHIERPKSTSSMAEIIACPSYLRIIGMGSRVLSLIIEQLEREGDEPDHWCAALEAVTGEDPVPEDAHGDTVRIAQEWIAWHRRNRVAWTFRNSTTRITESPAAGQVATTVLPGLLHPM